MRQNKQAKAGTEDFGALIEADGYYVDKTRFLRPLLTQTDDVALFTRPRRFGKTLTMSMLEEFLRIDPKSPGGSLRQQRLFKGLDVMDDRDLCNKFMGQFPVISITLKNVSGNNYREAIGMFAQSVSELAQDFDFLPGSQKLPSENKQILAILRSKQALLAEGDLSTLKTSISSLATMLYRHFGRKVAVLVDEYDVPLVKAQQNHYHKEMVELYAQFFGFLKKGNGTNPFFKTVMTGCLRVAKNQIFTGANNFTANTVLSLDRDFSSLFGFTPAEADAYLDAFGLLEYKAAVKEHYDGYRFGEDEIYNPWDVGKFVAEARKLADQGDRRKIWPGDYWTGSENTNTRAIKEYVSALSREDNQKLQDLSDGKEVEVAINDSMSYDRLDRRSARDMWSLLLHTGYVTAVREIRGAGQGGGSSENGEGNGIVRLETGPKYLVRIPNAEIRKCFCDSIMAGFDEDMRRDDANARVARALLCGDCAAAKELLQGLLRTYVSMRSLAMGRRPEFYYESMLVALLSTRSGAEIDELHEQPDAGEGYADISFTSYEGDIAVVVELKVSGTKDALDDAVKAALRQIEDRKYAERFINSRRIRKVIAIGMAFCKRVCEADCKILKGAVPANPE